MIYLLKTISAHLPAPAGIQPVGFGPNIRSHTSQAFGECGVGLAGCPSRADMTDSRRERLSPQAPFNLPV